MIKTGSGIRITFLAAATFALAAVAFAGSAGRAVIEPREDLKWAVGGAPQVSTAMLEGDMTKGASHFYLKYASGFVTPLHHHSADHYVTLVAGTLVLTVDGKDHRLTPGSYFALLGKKPHMGRCEGSDDCMMFIDARGAWDVVMEEKPAKN